MRKLSYAFALAMLVFFPLAAHAGGISDGRPITVDFRFPTPKLSVNPSGEIVASIEGLINTIDAGLPSVPLKTYMIALPAGTRLVGVSLQIDEQMRFKGRLASAASQLPISWIGNHPQNAHPVAAPAFEGDLYPAARTRVSLQMLHSVPIAIVNVYPLLWDRATESIEFVARGRLFVHYERTAEHQHPLFAHQVAEVRALVDDAAMLDSYQEREHVGADAYDYLIVTTDTFISYTGAGNLKMFQDGLAARGLKSRIVSVATIDSTGTGSDLVEKIRNHIRGEYERSGIKYVLLVGDGDSSGTGAMIPARTLWSRIYAYNGAWEWLEHNIPADGYYSWLDGVFNYNGNDKWGEPGDGDNGSDVDMLAEVTVGRWPIDTTTELKNIVLKTLWIYNNAVGKNTLLAGEELFIELNLYGDDYMEQLVGHCTDHNFETTGYGTDWRFTQMFDRQGRWDGDQALSQINSGEFAMINHLGHSSQRYNMRLYSNASNPLFTNTKPFFHYTQGCFPGDFTVECFTERILRQERGAFAVISNTAYGLAPEDPDPASTTTPGASQMLHRRFINAIFSESIPQLGRAHRRSKEAFVGMATAQEIRWVFWVANFFGDPSVEFRF